MPDAVSVNKTKTRGGASKIGRDTYVEWYRSMLLQRRFEEKTGQLYGMQKIRGFCHLYIGQEAVSAGTVSGTNPDDPIITAYRDHGLALARGMSARSAMAEMYGKVTGCVKGKGGSMHFFDKEHAFYGGHAIVGAQIPLGTGIAFADKYKENGKVTITFMGDGAVRQGSLHESFNLAAMWNIPVVYVIENNGYAMGTSVGRSGPAPDMYKLGAGFGIPGEPVDGMDVVAVHNAMIKACKHARSGKGPYLLEIRTYRYKGHSMSDPAKYRSKEELEAYRQRDPLEQVLQVIKEKKYLTKAELDAIQQEVKETVEDAVTFAEESPYPDPDAIYEDIYQQADYPYITD